VSPEHRSRVGDLGGRGDIENAVIRDIAFEGSGCAISRAAASMMTTSLKGKTLDEAEQLFKRFHHMLTASGTGSDAAELGELAVFSSVSEACRGTLCTPRLPARTSRSRQSRRANTMSDPSVIEKQVIDALRTCYDPEIPVNIYELGLIYEVKVAPNGVVNVQMTLTSPACPSAQELPFEAEAKVRTVPDVTDAKVEVVFDPPWDSSMTSEAAKLQLGLL
jgi:FeS assembly SUF system protein